MSREQSNLKITDRIRQALGKPRNLFAGGAGGLELGTGAVRQTVESFLGDDEQKPKSTVTPTPEGEDCEPPTEPPTNTPTEKPTITPTEPPTNTPTEPPTITPTEPPTNTPTEKPTVTPTEPPTNTPTEKPTITPTEPPTITPTEKPTITPTEPPTITPTEPPTNTPTKPPTITPTDRPPETPPPPPQKPPETPQPEVSPTYPPADTSTPEVATSTVQPASLPVEPPGVSGEHESLHPDQVRMCKVAVDAVMKAVRPDVLTPNSREGVMAEGIEEFVDNIPTSVLSSLVVGGLANLVENTEWYKAVVSGNANQAKLMAREFAKRLAEKFEDLGMASKEFGVDIRQRVTRLVEEVDQLKRKIDEMSKRLRKP